MSIRIIRGDGKRFLESGDCSGRVVELGEGVAEVVPGDGEVVIQLDGLAEALRRLTVPAKREQDVAKIEAQHGVGAADVQRVAIGTGGVLQTARFLSVQTKIAPFIRRM